MFKTNVLIVIRNGVQYACKQLTCLFQLIATWLEIHQAASIALTTGEKLGECHTRVHEIVLGLFLKRSPLLVMGHCH